MKLIKAIASAGVLMLTLSACGSTSGDDYPNEQSLNLIVPFGAGGAIDSTARAFAAAAEEHLGQRILVVNRPGGGAAIGATEAASANPDGYTLFLSTGSTFATTPLLQDVQYTPDDFEGVLGLADQPYIMVVSNDSGWESLDDIAESKERVTYAITGMGNATHLAVSRFLGSAGVEAEAIPFDAATDALQAVAGGQVDLAAVDLNIGAPQIEGGTVSALGITSDERVDAFPDVPTFEEAGYPEAGGFYSRAALAVPAGTPPETVEILREAAEAAVRSDDFREYLATNYLAASQFEDGSSWFNEFIPEERARAEEAFEDLGIGR